MGEERKEAKDRKEDEQQEKDSEDSDPDLIEICQQFFVLGPFDTGRCESRCEQLRRLKGQLFSKQNFVSFVEENIGRFGHSNARLLYRIKTEYFWNGAGNHMLINVLTDSSQLSSCINTLISHRNGIIKLSKYQIYLMVCHMLMGTFPPQLYLADPTFGGLLSVRDNEDELTCKNQIEFRLNKLKALIRYICVFFKRCKMDPLYGRKDYVIFQRHYDQFSVCKDLALITDDTTRLCKVKARLGEYYDDNHEIDAISINHCSNEVPGSHVMHISGSRFDLEEKIFLSHPEMMVLPALLYDPLQPGEALLVHGAEKFAALDAVSPYEQFSFSQSFVDKSTFDEFQECRKTTFLFVDRVESHRNMPNEILPDTWKIYSGLKGCAFLHSPSATSLVCGKFKSLAQKRSETGWEIRFLGDWIAASLAGWKQFHFFVSDQVEAKNLTMMVSELRDHSPADLHRIIIKYDELRLECRAKIRFMAFLQDFVV